MFCDPYISSPKITSLLYFFSEMYPIFQSVKIFFSYFIDIINYINSLKTCIHICEFSSVQSFSHVRLCNPMDCSTPGLYVHYQLTVLTQTHVHRLDDAIQPSLPLSTSSPPAFNLSQHQSLFLWVSSSHQVAKLLEFQPQHQSFQWIFRTDFL